MSITQAYFFSTIAFGKGIFFGLMLFVCCPYPAILAQNAYSPESAKFPLSARLYVDSLSFTESGDRVWNDLQLLDHAQRMMERGLLLTADSSIAQFVENYPNSTFLADALLLKGRLQIARGDYGKARVYFNEAIHTAERNANPIIPGIALYLIGASHAVEPNSPQIPQSIAALQTSAKSYPANANAGDALFALGTIAESKGDISAALSYFRTIIKNYPDYKHHNEAYLKVAECLIETGAYRDAIDQLHSLRDILPPQPGGEIGKNHDADLTANMLRLEGEAWRAMGDYAAAGQSYSAAAAAARTSELQRELLLNSGNTFLASGDYASAVKIYDVILTTSSGDLPGMKASYARAIAQMYANNLSDAVNALSTISKTPNHCCAGDAVVALSLLDYLHGDYIAASHSIDSLLKSPSDNPTAYLLQGLVSLARDSSVKAYYALKSAGQLARQLPGVEYRNSLIGTARSFEAVALVRARRYDEAVPELNQLLTQTTTSQRTDQSLFWLANAYYQSSLMAAASKSSQDLLQRFPTSQLAPDAMYTGGWALLRQQKFSDADRYFQRLRTEFPGSAYAGEAILRHGDCLYHQHQYAAALQVYEQLFSEEQNPVDEYSRYQAGMAAYSAGQWDVADQLFRAFNGRYGSSSLVDDAQYMEAMCAFQQSDYQTAIERFQHVIAVPGSSPLMPAAFYRLGVAYRESGNYPYALAAFNVASDMFTSQTYSPLARSSYSSLIANLKKFGNDNPSALAIQSAPAVLSLHSGDLFMDAGKFDLAVERFAVAEKAGLKEAVAYRQVLLDIANGSPVSSVRNTLSTIIPTDSSNIPTSSLLFISACYMKLKDSAAVATYFGLLRVRSEDTLVSDDERTTLQTVLEKTSATVQHGNYDKAFAPVVECARLLEQLSPPLNPKESRQKSTISSKTSVGRRATKGTVLGDDGGSSTASLTSSADEPADLSMMLLNATPVQNESLPLSKSPAPLPAPLTAAEFFPFITYTAELNKPVQALDREEFVRNESVLLPKHSSSLQAFGGLYSTGVLGGSYTFGGQDVSASATAMYSTTKGNRPESAGSQFNAGLEGRYTFGGELTPVLQRATIGASVNWQSRMYSLTTLSSFPDRSRNQFTTSFDYSNSIGSIDCNAALTYQRDRVIDAAGTVNEKSFNVVLGASTTWNDMKVGAIADVRTVDQDGVSHNCYKLVGNARYAINDQIHVGISAGAALGLDVLGSTVVKPVSNASITVYPTTTITVTGSIGTDVVQPTLSTLLTNNPYADPQSELRFGLERLQLKGAVRYEPSRSFAAQLCARYTVTDNRLYFDGSTNGMFLASYAPATTTGLSADWRWQPDEINALQGIVGVEQSNIEPTAISQNVDMPYIPLIHAKASYNRRWESLPFDMTLSGEYIGKRTAAGATMPGAAFVNVSAKYALTKQVVFEAQLNNLLDVRYQRWLGYPETGVFFGLGVKAFL